MNARYNAVIVGQTGVGKSALINYLYGQEVANSGVGKPVTKQGFHEIDFEIKGLPVRLFDSWGLEADQAETWMHDLEKELAERSVNESADKWFHSAFYCIQASGSRIQDCDIKIIKKFIENNYKISVVLTKSDLISEEEENLLRKELQKQINGISIIAVCNEGKKTRAGITEPFGKHEIEQQAFIDFFDSMILRLPLRCENLINEAIKNWGNTLNKDLKNELKFGGLNANEIANKIKESANDLQLKMLKLVNTEVEETLKMYGDFSKKLDYVPIMPGSLGRQQNYSDFNIKNNFSSLLDISWQDIKNEEYGIRHLYGIPLLLALYPVFAFTGKTESLENLANYIKDCQIELEKTGIEHSSNIRQALQYMKSKVTEQKND
jgi:GTP-binding protein EngB required for normal cell division